MSVLTLEQTTPTRIDYRIDGLMAPWVNSASVEIYDVNTNAETPAQGQFFTAANIKGSTGISGFFRGLNPSTAYIVWAYIYQSDGRESGRWNGAITTAAADPLRNIRGMHISGKDIYASWGLIPKERPSVMPTQVKTNYVELPGSSESIDYTSILLDRVPYGQRTGNWEFYFDPEWPGAKGSPALFRRQREGTLWAYVHGSIMNYLHGRRHTIVLRDDDSEIYFGRIELSGWKTDGKFSVVTLSYNINPPRRTS